MSPSDLRKADLSLRASFWLLFVLLLGVTGLPLVDRYESRIAPVVRDFRVLQADVAERLTVISGDMRKARDCDYLGLTWYVGDPNDRDAPRERLRFRFLDQPQDASPNRVAGRQSWGPWQLFQPVEVKGPAVFMRVTHRCHPLFDTSGVYFSRPAIEIFGEGYH